MRFENTNGVYERKFERSVKEKSCILLCYGTAMNRGHYKNALNKSIFRAIR